MTAPSRASYDGNLVNLLLLTASTAVSEPVWDIFNCLKIKILSINVGDGENGTHDNDQWQTLKASYLDLLVVKALIYQIPITVESETQLTLRQAIFD